MRFEIEPYAQHVDRMNKRPESLMEVNKNSIRTSSRERASIDRKNSEKRTLTRNLDSQVYT